jgi:hypothetical protein
MSRWIDRLAKVDCYELLDGNIIRHRGWFRREAVSLEQIASWRVEYEMCFDCVILDIGPGESLVWLDWDNDLLGILRNQIPARQVRHDLRP